MRDFVGNGCVAQAREYTDADHDAYLARCQARRDLENAAPVERALTTEELAEGYYA